MSPVQRHFRLVALFCLFFVFVAYFFLNSTDEEPDPTGKDAFFSPNIFEIEGNSLLKEADTGKVARLTHDERKDGRHTRPSKHTSRPSSVNKNVVWSIAKHEESHHSEIAQNNLSTEIDETVDRLSQILENKMHSAASMIRKAKTKPGCTTEATVSNSCDDGNCLRMEISNDPRERISQLVASKQLQLSTDEISILRNMRNKVSGNYDFVLLTTASSNHFLESQAMLKNLHENILPHLKNFTLIYYDLGLTPEERQKLVKYCKCNVVDFPFDKFPPFVQKLKCYSWKPIMIKAHLQQANILVWMDASVRFRNVSDFLQLVQRTKERGFQMGGPSEKSPFRTARSMYHFFGDEPCAYLQMGQLHAGHGFYKRDEFVNRAILEPWVACALNKNCICPDRVQQRAEDNIQMARKWRKEGGPIVYGYMHRFDQSAISLIIHKLFYQYYTWVVFSPFRHHISFLRNDQLNYFPSDG